MEEVEVVVVEVVEGVEEGVVGAEVAGEAVVVAGEVAVAVVVEIRNTGRRGQGCLLVILKRQLRRMI